MTWLPLHGVTQAFNVGECAVLSPDLGCQPGDTAILRQILGRDREHESVDIAHVVPLRRQMDLRMVLGAQNALVRRPGAPTCGRSILRCRIHNVGQVSLVWCSLRLSCTSSITERRAA